MSFKSQTKDYAKIPDLAKPQLDFSEINSHLDPGWKFLTSMKLTDKLLFAVFWHKRDETW